MEKTGLDVTLFCSPSQGIKTRDLRNLIKDAGLTVDEFVALL